MNTKETVLKVKVFFILNPRTFVGITVFWWMGIAGILFILESTQQTKVLRHHS